MLKIEVRGDQEVIAKFRNAGDRARIAVRRAITILQLKLEAHIKNDKLSGQVLNVRSGNLRASIHSPPLVETGDKITGYVASSGDVKYAAIHEFGGRIPGRTIEAKGKALAFSWKGEQVFFKSVNWPGATMPERSFMRSALADMRTEIRRDIERAVVQATR